MLEYIKSVIGQRMDEQSADLQIEDIDNSTILEYASVFQELDDLTEHGTAIDTAVRTPISIPLEDDIELDSIEINLTDGRVTDIPADATVNEFAQISQKYAAMKTFNDFYTEAYNSMSRLPRESYDKFNDRVRREASINWDNYNKMLYQEGVFGHDKVSIDDISVPYKIHLNFGPTSEKDRTDYAVTLNIGYEVDKKNRVTKKQLDSVQVFSKFGKSSLMKMSDDIYRHVCDKYKVNPKKNKWDVLTPVNVVVPIDPTDKYAIAIGFETEFSKDTDYWVLSIPVKALSFKKNTVDVPDNAVGDVSSLNISTLNKVTSKRDFKLEQHELRRPRRWGGYYQEAIDFGGDADAVDTGNDTNNNGDTPPVDNSDTGSDVSVNANGGNEQQPTANAAPAAVNDVSDQIADKVSDITTQQNNVDAGGAESGDLELNVDDEGTGDDVDLDIDTSNETPADDASINDVDSQIDSLDAEGETDMSAETPDSLDDMTIDELIAQGSEKLKGMTINQLKTFITSPDGTTPEDVQAEDTTTDTTSLESAYTISDEKVMMENFFSDASNIKKRMNTAINDVMPGLNIIYKNCSNGSWDRYKLREFWASVRKEDDPNDISFDVSTEVRKGNQFRSYVSDLQHYLKVSDKKRARSAFTESDLSTLKECNNKLEDLHKTCDKASSKFAIKNDKDMSEVGEKAKIAIEACETIRGIISSDEYTEFYIQEAAFITKKNITNEMGAHIASSLGILNDTKTSFPQLVKMFTTESKSLNKILTKAGKMNSVYSKEELAEINKLNSILTELSSSIRLNNLNTQYTKKIKSLISDYAKQCKVVGAIVSKKTGKKVVKESYQKACQTCPITGKPIAEDTDLDTSSGTTTTADTTTGTDITTSNASTSDVASSTDSSPSTEGIPSNTDYNTTQESDESEVSKKFNEFMNEFK